MRSDLKTAGATNVETDLDELTCKFVCGADVDTEALLNKLAENNSKIKNWEKLE